MSMEVNLISRLGAQFVGQHSRKGTGSCYRNSRKMVVGYIWGAVVKAAMEAVHHQHGRREEIRSPIKILIQY